MVACSFLASYGVLCKEVVCSSALLLLFCSNAERSAVVPASAAARKQGCRSCKLLYSPANAATISCRPWPANPGAIPSARL